ncbi:MAG: Holliday junction branch migration protein RuvA [Gammaproteobacteria bacterium]|nr:Holliday junction branch migration protein RuvA [Gammaproteobacteria bacterium]
MIAWLRGTLRVKRAPRLVVDVHGVGYELEAPMTTFYELPEVGQPVSLHTHQVVREDTHQLYAFRREEERNLFRMMLRVSGVGARLALAILSGMDAAGFARCVQEGDTASLARLPGIGKKTAERLVVEMRDRLAGERVAADTGVALMGTAHPSAADPVAEAVSALVALGFKPHEASRQVRALECRDLSSEEIVRRALQSLVK